MGRTRFFLVTLTLASAAAALGVSACGDDDDGAAPPGRVDGGGDSATPPPDGGGPQPAPDAGDGGVNPAVIARGKYLVDHVGACGDCHTPRGPMGAPDMTRYLAGTDCFIDVNGDQDGGCLNAANLTNHPTGLKNFRDNEVKTMFMDGKRPDGRNLSSVMPYYVLHNLRAEDADAIVAYLRTVPPIEHAVPPNDPPFAPVPNVAVPIEPATIPAADGGAVENGRYLAALACLECHTPELPPGSPRPVDMTKPFGGNKPFPAAMLGLPSPPFPAEIRSANLTPHATGIQGWTAADIVRAVKQGKDRTDGGVCPPMPSGPMGALAGLTDQDALDIANYIVGLPPIDNAVSGGNGACVGP